MAHEQSITVGIDGKFYNIPSVLDRDGKPESPAVAIEHAKKNNLFTSPFDNVPEAVAAAKARSASMQHDGSPRVAPVAPQTPRVAPKLSTPATGFTPAEQADLKAMGRDSTGKVVAPSAPTATPAPDKPPATAPEFVNKPYEGNAVADAIRKYDPLIEKYSQKYGVSPNIIRGIMYRESGGNPGARSESDARGLMQVLPSTFAGLGIPGDISDPEVNIEAGVKYYSQQQREFGTVPAALAAYHQGPGATRGSRGQPIGPKTRQYVNDVPQLAARFALSGGRPTAITETSAAQPTPQQSAVARLAASDPRLPVIHEAIRIIGGDPVKYEKKLQDPNYVNKFYSDAMRHAETVDPKLTMNMGEGAYLAALKSVPGPNDPPKPAATAPVAPPASTELMFQGKPVFPNKSKDNPSPGDETIKQVVGGGLLDATQGAVETLEDSALIMKKFETRLAKETSPGFASGVARELTPLPVQAFQSFLKLTGINKPSSDIEAFAKAYIGQPKNLTDSVGRGIFGFLAPYLTGVKAMGVTTKVGKAATSAAVNFAQPIDMALGTEAITGLVKELWSGNPAEGADFITRYINNEITDDVLIQQLIKRGVRAGEDTLFGIGADLMIAFIRKMRLGRFGLLPKEAKPPEPAATIAPASPSPSPIPVSQPKDLAGMSETTSPGTQGDLFARQTERTAPLQPANVITGEQLELSLDKQLGPSGPELSQVVNEATDLAGELAALPKLTRIEMFRNHQAVGILSKLSGNLDNPTFIAEARRWLQSTAKLTGEDISLNRMEIERLLGDTPPAKPTGPIAHVDITVEKTSQEVQDQLLNHAAESPEQFINDISKPGARGRMMDELTQSGMQPHEANEFIGRLMDVTSEPPSVVKAATHPKTPTSGLERDLRARKESQAIDNTIPETTSTDIIIQAAKNPENVSKVERVVAAIQRGFSDNPAQTNLNAGRRTPQLPDNNLPPIQPGPSDNPMQAGIPEFKGKPDSTIIQAASEAVDKPEGLLKPIVDALKNSGLDDVGKKALIAVALKGTLSGLIAAELVSPGGALASDGDDGVPMTTSEKALTIGLAAIVGGVVGIKALRGLTKKIVESTAGLKSQTADVPVARTVATPSLTPTNRALLDKGVKLSKIHAVKDLTPAELDNFQDILEGTEPRWDQLTGPQDLNEIKASANQMLRNVPEESRMQYMGTPIDSFDEQAAAIGMNPRELRAVINSALNPREASNKIKTLVYLSLKLNDQVKKLGKAYFDGMPGVDRSAILDAGARAYATYGHISNAREVFSSDLARGMNVLRQASDGRMAQITYDGINAGDIFTHPESADKFMKQLVFLADLGPGNVGKAAKKALAPTFTGAITQGFIHSLLATAGTTVNTAWSAATRLMLNPLIRTVGGVVQEYGSKIPGSQYLPEWLAGKYVPGTSIAAEEGLGMFTEMISHVKETFQVGVRVAVTGEAVFLEHGASMGAHGPSQIVREAFGPVPGAMDTMGALVGLPNAGNIFNYIGSFLEVVGTRGLVAVDEMTQFLAEKGNLKAEAIRASKGLVDASDEQVAEFIADFMENPTQAAIQRTKAYKTSSSYMNNLFDETGSYAPMRQLMGRLNETMAVYPAARILFPFLKATTNLLTFTSEISPGLNLISGGFREALTSPDPWIRGEAQGRFAVSLALGFGAMWLGANGIVRGALTTNNSYRQMLKEAGTPENSIDIGEHTLAINSREPTGFVITAFGQLGQILFGNRIHDDELHPLMAVFLSLYNLLTDQTIAGAISEAVEGLDPAELSRRIKRLGEMGVAVETLDDLVLKPFLPPRQWQEVLKIIQPAKQVYDGYFDKLRSRTWASDEGINETDIFGDVRYVGGGLTEDSLNNGIRVFTGLNMAKIAPNELKQRLVKKQIHVPEPRAIFQMGQVTVPLNRKETQELRTLISHPPGFTVSLKEATLALTGSDYWKGLQGGKGGMAEIEVQNLVQMYSDVARDHLLARSETLGKRIQDMRKVKGIDSER